MGYIIDEPNWALKIAQMAEVDTRIEWNETASRLSENSREILQNEFTEYLLNSKNKGE